MTTFPDLKIQYNELVSYGQTIQNRKFTIAEFTGILRKFVGCSSIKVKTARDKEVDKNQVIIGGIYDPDDDASNIASITIYVTYNPDQKRICIRDIDWPGVCLNLIECTGHEIIHQTQYRLRNFDIGSSIFVSLSTTERRRIDQEYLGNPDEVEAYGYSIAVEVFLKYDPTIITLKYIAKSSMYKVYVNAFGANHKVVRSLLSYVGKYYDVITEKNHAKNPQQCE
jgi:hypothetical protein